MLVDTSVWIDHVRRPERELIGLLDDNHVDVHAFVIGELACGHLRPRDEMTRLLTALPWLPTVEHEEAFTLLQRHRLHGRGVGWIDVHLLASTLVAGTALWTRDRRMAAVARDLKIDLFNG
jgi:predicted nucleic acid-binding protein